MDGAGRSTGVQGWAAVVAAVARRPDLWGIALLEARRLVPTRWWRRRPPLPLPDPAYLRFRLQTAYGGDPAATDAPFAPDVVAWLEWCGGMRRSVRYPAER